jgi:glycosyltransferase involved in cell wall biosynthesis
VRVTLLTQYYPPELGAPQARISALASAFARRGHAVTVLTAMPSYPQGRIYPGYRSLLRREDDHGVRVIRTPIFPTQNADFIRRLTNYFSFVFSSAALGGLLLEPCDFVMVESPPLFLGLAGVWLSWLKGASMIFNVSDLWPESAVRLGVLQTDSLAYRLSAWLEAFCYRHACLVTGQTREIVADIAARFPGCRTYHLSNGVDNRVFHPDRRTEMARAMLGARGPETCIALYAGLHGLAQGLEQVLDAAEGLSEDGRLQIVLLGDGPLKGKLTRRARERGLTNVRFLDPLPSDHVPALLAAADIVMVPLATHIPGATPSKLYEAMASARPVALVADGEPAALIREQHAGLVVPPGDVPGLVQALRALQNDPNLRRELGANGRRAVEAQFDRVAIGDRFVEYLEQYLETAKVRRPSSKSEPSRAL